MTHEEEKQQVFDALEATAPPAKNKSPFGQASATRQEISNHRDLLLRFLVEIDAEISVGELRDMLEEFD